ncbi:MAG: xylulokinase [Lachnospiraceae bacterium]|nr:xylulokinase [Lachnospiraceae bacterium]
MKQQLLGIDIGTSACKVAVFDEDGKVLAQANRPYRVYYPQNGWAEQNPEEWWEAICDAVREALSEESVSAEQIKGIGVDGQSWSAIPVDENGSVLHNTPIWMDTRARHLCEKVKKEIGADEIFRVAGNDFLPSYVTPKLLWFKEERPEVFQKTHKFLQSNSYIVMKLTGEMSQEYSQCYGIHFFHMEKLSYDMALAEKMGLSPDMMPKLYGCDEIVGSLTEEAAKKTGLKAGTPVVAGGLDAACGALGAGVYRPGETQEQGGQAGGMSICTDKALSHKALILGTHVVPGLWLLQGGTVGGGGALKWFRQELGGGMSFDELTAEAAEAPPGSDGVLFLPYMAGERSPIWNPDAKGVFYGLSFDKTRGHLIRSVLEGVAFSLEHNLRTAAETGIHVDTLNAMGGASNSVLWTQIKADVTGKTIRVPSSDTATTLGAAILAGVGCGIYGSYGEAVNRTIRMTRVQEPNPENKAVYDRAMERYLRLYEDLKEGFSL